MNKFIDEMSGVTVSTCVPVAGAWASSELIVEEVCWRNNEVSLVTKELTRGPLWFLAGWAGSIAYFARE
jgi:hypothetical protein